MTVARSLRKISKSWNYVMCVNMYVCTRPGRPTTCRAVNEAAHHQDDGSVLLPSSPSMFKVLSTRGHPYKTSTIWSSGSVWAEFKQSIIDKAIDHWRPSCWGHVFVPMDNTLNNWLIEITVCLLNSSVFTRTLFRANFEFKLANIHIGPFQFVKNSYFEICKVVWRRYLGEVGKFYHTLRLIYPRNCISISIKIGQVL